MFFNVRVKRDTKSLSKFFRTKSGIFFTVFQCDSPKHTQRQECTLNANPVHIHQLLPGMETGEANTALGEEKQQDAPDHQRPSPSWTGLRAAAAVQQAEWAATTWSLSLILLGFKGQQHRAKLGHCQLCSCII